VVATVRYDLSKSTVSTSRKTSATQGKIATELIPYAMYAGPRMSLRSPGMIGSSLAEDRMVGGVVEGPSQLP
jgi:hypothetical protein